MNEVNNTNNEEEVRSDRTDKVGVQLQPYQARVRLPGFITDEDIGLGDVLKRVTHAVGVKPCGGCDRRAAALNRWFVFSGRRSR